MKSMTTEALAVLEYFATARTNEALRVLRLAENLAGKHEEANGAGNRPVPTTPASPARPGAAPPKRGLGPDEVRRIRRAYLTQEIPEIAAEHGISESHVVGIANRVSWTSVPPGPGEFVPTKDIEGTGRRKKAGNRRLT